MQLFWRLMDLQGRVVLVTRERHVAVKVACGMRGSIIDSFRARENSGVCLSCAFGVPCTPRHQPPRDDGDDQAGEPVEA